MNLKTMIRFSYSYASCITDALNAGLATQDDVSRMAHEMIESEKLSLDSDQFYILKNMVIGTVTEIMNPTNY